MHFHLYAIRRIQMFYPTNHSILHWVLFYEVPHLAGKLLCARMHTVDMALQTTFICVCLWTLWNGTFEWFLCSFMKIFNMIPETFPQRILFSARSNPAFMNAKRSLFGRYTQILRPCGSGGWDWTIKHMYLMHTILQNSVHKTYLSSSDVDHKLSCIRMYTYIFEISICWSYTITTKFI